MPGGYRDSVTKPSTRSDEDVIARQGGSAVHVRERGYVRIAVKALSKLKIKIDDQFFELRPQALMPSTPEED